MIVYQYVTFSVGLPGSLVDSTPSSFSNTGLHSLTFVDATTSSTCLPLNMMMTPAISFPGFGADATDIVSPSINNTIAQHAKNVRTIIRSLQFTGHRCILHRITLLSHSSLS